MKGSSVVYVIYESPLQEKSQKLPPRPPLSSPMTRVQSDMKRFFSSTKNCPERKPIAEEGRTSNQEIVPGVRKFRWRSWGFRFALAVPWRRGIHIGLPHWDGSMGKRVPTSKLKDIVDSNDEGYRIQNVIRMSYLQAPLAATAAAGA